MRFNLLLSVAVLSMGLAGCGSHSNDVWENANHTGDRELELQTGSLKAEEMNSGMIAYVAPQRLNIRSEAKVTPDNIVAVLDANDKVEIVEINPVGENAFVGVKVIESKAKVDRSVVYYTSANHLNGKPQAVQAPAVQANKYFIVTNIASEKVRVYRTCEKNEGCVNKMIFEQDVVNGEDDDGTRTDVGAYRITSWDKFYEVPGVYPAWYRPGYPQLPSPRSGMSDWVSSRVMPGGKGDFRGAFGWYTAKVGPNPRAQWMHGTAGWGSDKKKFILFKETFRGAILNLFVSIRSHGCTRIDNESIAYLRSLLPVGTPYIKIYAKEAYRDKTRATYSKQPASWSYILTTLGYGKTDNHQVADRDTVLKQATPQSQWLDQGSLEIDQYPDAVPFGSRDVAKGGDLYKIGGRSFRGAFLVDEGTVVNYEHPKQMSVGGYPDQRLPNVMMANGPIAVPDDSEDADDTPKGGNWGSRYDGNGPGTPFPGDNSYGN